MEIFAERKKRNDCQDAKEGFLAVSLFFSRAIVVVMAMIIGSVASNGAAREYNPVGTVAYDPIAETQAQISAHCGSVGIAGGDISRGDYTGDGREDVIILIDSPCPARHRYCDRDGCPNLVWVGVGHGRYELTNKFFANEISVAESRGRPALKLDNGQVWVWRGNAFERVSRSFVALQPAPAPPVRQPTGPAAPDFEQTGGHTPGSWVFQRFSHGDVARTMVVNRSGARLVFACAPKSDDVTMRYFPLSNQGSAYAVGDQVLVDFVVDQRVVARRLLVAVADNGPLAEPSIAMDTDLIRRIRGGDVLAIQESGIGQSMAVFGLAGSSRALKRLMTYCG
jgi:hypothetical protein